MNKQLGKISGIKLGQGGYDDAMYGVTFIFTTDDGGVMDFKGTWRFRSEHAKYTHEEWERSHKDAYFFLMKIMKEAKVTEFRKLEGIPVELNFNGNTLHDWRILTEVL